MLLFLGSIIFFFIFDAGKRVLSTKGADAWRPAAAAPWKQSPHAEEDEGKEEEEEERAITHTITHIIQTVDLKAISEMSVFKACLTQSVCGERPSLMCIPVQERSFSFGGGKYNWKKSGVWIFIECGSNDAAF